MLKLMKNIAYVTIDLTVFYYLVMLLRAWANESRGI
jgi:hypothetical protein